MRVTRLLAVMDTTIEGAIARVSASEHTSPFLGNVLAVLGGMLFVTCDFVTTVSAK